ncbi:MULTISPECIES: YciI family protein [unclassified Actinotalea]|uniref:YciI family protein n=1 Tax=unclassified Actinotalea TaxID=2638618 RepID=UPI0015F57753|nr:MULTISPECIES: YciI family protein [unclassified Actinotalea]
MKFLVLIYQDESVWRDATPAEQERYYAEHEAFSAAVPERGCTMLAGEALVGVASATTVRRRGEHVDISEGPFAETAEQLGGFYLLDAPDLDAVTDLCRLLPEYTLEIRPVADMD